MEIRKNTASQIGMLFGIFTGGGIGVLLFVFTQNPLYFTVIGIGLVLGLIIGAGIDRNQETHQEK